MLPKNTLTFILSVLMHRKKILQNSPVNKDEIIYKRKLMETKFNHWNNDHTDGRITISIRESKVRKLIVA